MRDLIAEHGIVEVVARVVWASVVIGVMLFAAFSVDIVVGTVMTGVIVLLAVFTRS